MAGEYFQILKNEKGQYWWRLRGGNHESIGWSGETYIGKQHTINMADKVRRLPVTTPIHDKTGE